jgi:plastocyanin
VFEMKRAILALTVALVVAGLTVAGCGSSGKSSSSSSTPSTSSGASTGATSTNPAASTGTIVKVHMANIAFVPRTLQAKVGEVVQWINDDPVDHNVTAVKGASFASKNFGMGGTFTFKLTQPGTIDYNCTLHPGMTATIVVG